MTGHKSAGTQQIEVITLGERRRSWSAEQKREIVAESLEHWNRAIRRLRWRIATALAAAHLAVAAAGREVGRRVPAADAVRPCCGAERTAKAGIGGNGRAA